MSQQSQESQPAEIPTHFKSGESGLPDSNLTWLTWLNSNLPDLTVRSVKSAQLDLSQVSQIIFLSHVGLQSVNYSKSELSQVR